MKIKFSEQQRFRQLWLWIPLIGITLLPAYGCYRQVILGSPFGNNPMPNYGLVIMLLFMLAMVGFFWSLRLHTVIDDERITVSYAPFINKEFKWKDVKKAEVIDFGFVGGWGMRLGTQYGTVYNISGSIGLALQLKSGRKLLVGTQREAELKAVINEVNLL